MTRRYFLRVAGSGAMSLLLTNTRASLKSIKAPSRTLRFAVISDLHCDLMHDGQQRVQKFIGSMKQEKPDFIIQLGDFCIPVERNQKTLAIWNEFPKSYHVLGNHDTDHGFTKEQVIKFWDMPSSYYSFDKNGYHFVVLDGNEKLPDSKLTGYPRNIGKEQLEWLEKDLMATAKPSVIFCHQGLDNDHDGLQNGMEVRYLLEQINKRSKTNKVKLVFSGHHHLNYHNEINGIHYVQINSASYYWMGEDYRAQQFDEAFYIKYPILKHTLVYQDPIWAMVSLSKNNIRIFGKKTSITGIEGNDLKMDKHKDVYPITASIDDRNLRY